MEVHHEILTGRPDGLDTDTFQIGLRLRCVRTHGYEDTVDAFGSAHGLHDPLDDMFPAYHLHRLLYSARTHARPFSTGIDQSFHQMHNPSTMTAMMSMTALDISFAAPRMSPLTNPKTLLAVRAIYQPTATDIKRPSTMHKIMTSSFRA